MLKDATTNTGEFPSSLSEVPRTYINQYISTHFEILLNI